MFLHRHKSKAQNGKPIMELFERFSSIENFLLNSFHSREIKVFRPCSAFHINFLENSEIETFNAQRLRRHQHEAKSVSIFILNYFHVPYYDVFKRQKILSKEENLLIYFFLSLQCPIVLLTKVFSKAATQKRESPVFAKSAKAKKIEEN